MMQKYLKESLRWIHLALFKPSTFKQEAERLSFTKIGVFASYKISPIIWVFTLVPFSVVGLSFELSDRPFNWVRGCWGILVGCFIGLGYGLAGSDKKEDMFSRYAELEKGKGPFIKLIIRLPTYMIFGLFGHVFGGGPYSHFFGGLFGGLLGALATGLTLAMADPGIISPPSYLDTFLQLYMAPAMFAGMIGVGLGRFGVMIYTGFWGGFVGSLIGVLVGMLDKTSDKVNVFFLVGFSIAFLRSFYLIPYAIQYWRARSANDPFILFKNSPVYWDEVMATPLPLLADWLVKLAMCERQQGVAEINFVVTHRPYQRLAAQKALLMIAIQDIQKIDSIKLMAGAAAVIKFLPADADYQLKGLNDVQRRINDISYLAQDYLTRLTPVGQAKVLEELRREVQTFHDAMVLAKRPIGPAFLSIASRWLEVVKAAEAECRERLDFTSIDTPFIVGNPLHPRDQELFKGRKDMIVAIEENIINSGQRPALMLYGWRRIGKSSTLLNLPRLLSSRFVPVFT